MSLEITAAVDGENRRLDVTGEVDVSCANELRAAIDAQIAKGVTGELVVDLAGVPYIDSTGIGVLVGAAHHAAEHEKGFEAGATFVVARPQRNVERVLGLLGVQADLNIRKA